MRFTVAAPFCYETETYTLKPFSSPPAAILSSMNVHEGVNFSNPRLHPLFPFLAKSAVRLMEDLADLPNVLFADRPKMATCHGYYERIASNLTSTYYMNNVPGNDHEGFIGCIRSNSRIVIIHELHIRVADSGVRYDITPHMESVDYERVLLDTMARKALIDDFLVENV